MYTNIHFVFQQTSHPGRSVSISYLFWLASGMQIQLLTHSLERDKQRTKNTAIMHKLIHSHFSFFFPVIPACKFLNRTVTHPSSALRVPVQDTARVISSLPLWSVRHLAGMINKHLSCKICVYLQTKMCVWMSHLRERPPSVHELLLADQSRETGTQHSPAATVHSAPWFLLLPAVHKGKSVEKDFTFKYANISREMVWVIFQFDPNL